MNKGTMALSDVAIIRTGKLDSNAAIENGKYPFFTCDPNTLSIDEWAYDTEAVLLAGNNASGNYTAKYYKGKFNAYQRTYIIESKSKDLLDVRFLCYAINQQLRLLKAMSAGTSTKFLTLAILNGIRLPFCPIIQQKKIAATLGTYDDLIENNNRQIKLLEEAAQRLYKEWFIDLHFPGYEDCKIVDGVPEGWKREPLGAIFDVVRGKSYSSKELSDKDGIPMVNLSNIRPFGGYIRNQEKHFTGKYKGEQVVSSHNLVMGVTDMTQERRTVGRVALIPKLHSKAIISMDLIKLCPHNEFSLFYYALFKYGGYSELVSRFANGTNVLHLRPEVLDFVDAILPNEKLQFRYNEFVKEIQNRIDAMQDQIILAEEARDRLLPKLMSGEIEV